MNKPAVKKHILEEMAHGKPIQMILSPECPKIDAGVDEDGRRVLIDDPDWVKPDLPDWNIVVQWLKEDEVFRNEWENARKFGAAYLADEMIVLKNALLKDPKNASAYKTAMEMIKTSAMWRDAKYSDRVIQDVNNNIPQDADVVLARVKQLREELGLNAPINTLEMGPVVEEPKKKGPTDKQLAHYKKLNEARAAAQLARKNTRGKDDA